MIFGQPKPETCGVWWRNSRIEGERRLVDSRRLEEGVGRVQPWETVAMRTKLNPNKAPTVANPPSSTSVDRYKRRDVGLERSTRV
jgi:hypothetical protein